MWTYSYSGILSRRAVPPHHHAFSLCLYSGFYYAPCIRSSTTTALMSSSISLHSLFRPILRIFGMTSRPEPQVLFPNASGGRVHHSAQHWPAVLQRAISSNKYSATIEQHWAVELDLYKQSGTTAQHEHIRAIIARPDPAHDERAYIRFDREGTDTEPYDSGEVSLPLDPQAGALSLNYLFTEVVAANIVATSAHPTPTSRPLSPTGTTRPTFRNMSTKVLRRSAQSKDSVGSSDTVTVSIRHNGSDLAEIDPKDKQAILIQNIIWARREDAPNALQLSFLFSAASCCAGDYQLGDTNCFHVSGFILRLALTLFPKGELHHASEAKHLPANSWHGWTGIVSSLEPGNGDDIVAKMCAVYNDFVSKWSTEVCCFLWPNFKPFDLYIGTFQVKEHNDSVNIVHTAFLRRFANYYK